jgi:hypothetical protein
MTGRTLSLRLFALTFGLACAIFVIIAGYRGLLAYTDPMLAPIAMAGLSAFVAISFIVMAQMRATRRRERFTAIMSSLIDHKPLAGLAAAVVAGAAARFGIEPDDLFPIFDAFTPPPSEPPAMHTSAPTSAQSSNAPAPTPSTPPATASQTPNPSNPPQSIH